MLNALTDESLKQEVARGFRTLGFLAWHLAQSAAMLHSAGVKFEVPQEKEAPATAAAISQAYQQTSQALLDAVQTQLKDENLQETVNFFGMNWKTDYLLYSFLKHEVHHRGQITILMRQAGIPVSGAYGPAKEEWVAFGMEAPV
ncbi:DinB family protein [Neobacillus pocheonensis]|uniref:DinB family protein n=1 Tax=Neobacillus pocheonensis TaxID=363869 RepID=A0ABT0WHG0_9BACI|nr:DinB family protein [Neobacillus pocheonensis]